MCVHFVFVSTVYMCVHGEWVWVCKLFVFVSARGVCARCVSVYCGVCVYGGGRGGSGV